MLLFIRKNNNNKPVRHIKVNAILPFSENLKARSP
jgi:hypothetical protein